jgi:two-component system cell cycle sensor histidine kinase/response regulator CckA
MFWNALDIEPVCDDHGCTTHFIGAIRDVSEQKAAQMRLSRMEKMDALGQLASGITHDFNNILAATRTFADLIAEAIPTGSRQHGYARRIIAACDRAADLVRQLMTLARAKDAPRDLLSVREVIQEATALLPGRLPKGVKLSAADSTRKGVVLANASQLAQVLLNLAVNACDAMASRGGELTISAYDITVPDEDSLPFVKGVRSDSHGVLCATGALKPRVPYVRIAVTDTGAGISEDIAARIFEPFFTTKERRNESGCSGSGLGLSIVNSIVAAHDGVIAVQSRTGEGSAFQIYLPAHRGLAKFPRPKTRPNPTAPAPESLRGTERILVIDDEVDVADAVAISLGRLGYDAKAIYSAVDAFDLFIRDPDAWDAIITDQSMPQMNGRDLVGKIKFIRPEIKTILSTGHSAAATVETVWGDGVDAVFTKPTPIEDMAACLRRLIGAGLAKA